MDLCGKVASVFIRRQTISLPKDFALSLSSDLFFPYLYQGAGNWRWNRDGNACLLHLSFYKNAPRGQSRGIAFPSSSPGRAANDLTNSSALQALPGIDSDASIATNQESRIARSPPKMRCPRLGWEQRRDPTILGGPCFLW